MAVANAICVMDRAFRRRAEVCLKGVADKDWIPEEEEWTKKRPMIDWVDPPKEGGFKVIRRGPKGKSDRVYHASQFEQVCEYTKYQTN